MNAQILKITAIAAFVAAFGAWIYGGAQAGFYKTFYQIKKVDEITGLSYSEEVPALLPGVETLALGFGVFVLLLAVSEWMELKAKGARQL
ncbi:hypothetical protein [Pelagicoccus albus]|uniref:Uncharacterized protein n=1 Tax=Pelagicoccus albus TaxID=415222 RepID=A0A7X1B5S9_9BACT|nr:hypothetical protein [Pelagicoccus albus]MBC2605068.1 hypothetical protein [Pelagicoccus albus]